MLAEVDWRSVGAVAGPVLALISLAWQASERLRRPVLDHRLNFDTLNMKRPDSSFTRPVYEDAPYVRAYARVLNPRPNTIVIGAVELQARRTGPLGRFRRPEVLASSDRPEPVAAGKELEISVTRHRYWEPRDLRVSVRLRGHRRRLNSPWTTQAGAMTITLVRKAQENNPFRRAAELQRQHQQQQQPPT